MRKLQSHEYNIFPSFLQTWKDDYGQIDLANEICYNQLSKAEKQALSDTIDNLYLHCDRPDDRRPGFSGRGQGFLWFVNPSNFVASGLKVSLGRNDRNGCITVAIYPEFDKAEKAQEYHDEYNHLLMGFLTGAASAGTGALPCFKQIGLWGIEAVLNPEWNNRLGYATVFPSLGDFVKAVNAISRETSVELKTETRIEPLARLYEISGPPSLAELGRRKQASKPVLG